MAIISSASTLPSVSFSPHPPSSSLSLSPKWVFCLPKKRAFSSSMVSSLNNPFLPSMNPNEFYPIYQDGSDYLPFANVVASSSPMEPARPQRKVERKIDKSERDEQKGAVSYPPDFEARLLFSRVIVVDYPLVDVISELIISQLLYLQGMNPNEPIYMYIKSSGTHNEDGDPVGFEADGFAVYDIMTSLKNEVHTLLLGPAVGHGVLLLAAGTKGKRYMMPHAKAKIQEPRVPPFGEMQTTDLVLRAREALIQRNKFAELVGLHTGNSTEEVQKLMKTRLFMDFSKAKEYGFADKIYEREKHRRMADIPNRDEMKLRRKTIKRGSIDSL